MWTVYKATAPDGKAYIGRTSQGMAHRRQDHEKEARTGSEFPFHCAIRKHGADKIEWKVIACVDTIAEANWLEMHYISEYNTIVPNGYNAQAGGKGGAHCAETKAKISERAKARWAAMSEDDRRTPPEMRAKLSESGKAYWAGVARDGRAARVAAMVAANTGVKRSSAAIANMSAAQKKRYAAMTDEARALRAAKMSAGVKAAKARKAAELERKMADWFFRKASGGSAKLEKEMREKSDQMARQAPTREQVWDWFVRLAPTADSAMDRMNAKAKYMSGAA